MSCERREVSKVFIELLQTEIHCCCDFRATSSTNKHRGTKKKTKKKKLQVIGL